MDKGDIDLRKLQLLREQDGTGGRFGPPPKGCSEDPTPEDVYQIMIGRVPENPERGEE